MLECFPCSDGLESDRGPPPDPSGERGSKKMKQEQGLGPQQMESSAFPHLTGCAGESSLCGSGGGGQVHIMMTPVSTK